MVRRSNALSAAGSIAAQVQERGISHGKLSPSLEPLDMASAEEDSAKQPVRPDIHSLSTAVMVQEHCTPVRRVPTHGHVCRFGAGHISVLRRKS